MHTLVAVVGPGNASGELLAVAEEVGVELARAGVGVACGGLGGVMEAACRGAKRQGGLTVGLLPGDDPAVANPFVDVAVPTGFGEARNALVVRAATAVIAVGGEYGTLSEIAFALKAGIPVVGIGTWQLYKDGRRRDAFAVARDAADGVGQALRLAGHRPTVQEPAD